MSADGVAGSFVTKFQKPAMTLRYGMRYDVVVDALTDFAGNAAINPAGLYFFTKALPHRP